MVSEPTSYPAVIPSADPIAASQASYDIAIIGLGALGAVLAHSFAQSGRSVLALERDLAVPDRIVGELLQPGGVLALRKLGLADVFRPVDGTDGNEDPVGAVASHGMAVFWHGRHVHIPYPQESVPMPWSDGGTPAQPSASFLLPQPIFSWLAGVLVSVIGFGADDDDDLLACSCPRRKTDRWPGKQKLRQQGRSFHHGPFIQSLRARAVAANCSGNSGGKLTVVHATVNDLARSDDGTVTGVLATPFGKRASDDEPPLLFRAKLTIVADGCFSKFRRELLPPNAVAPTTRSTFVGLVLPDADMPFPHHGHVVLPSSTAAPLSPGPGNVPRPTLGPILIYQLSSSPHETRMLVDLPSGLPQGGAAALPATLEAIVPPHLPSSLLPSFRAAIRLAKTKDAKYRLRSMPNQYLPATIQGRAGGQRGVLLAGDAMNMRHPLTGGGMTVAFSDAVLLTELLGGGLGPVIDRDGRAAVELDRWPDVAKRLEEWYWRRKGVGVCVNTLAMALYDLFSAEDPYLDILRRGCFAYFELGGRAVSDPVSLLSALNPSPGLLTLHFFAVAFYSIYVLFTQPGANRKEAPSIWEYPQLFLVALGTIHKACVVLLPVIWREFT